MSIIIKWITIYSPSFDHQKTREKIVSLTIIPSQPAFRQEETRRKTRRKIARQSRKLRATVLFCASRRVRFKFARIMRATDGAVLSGKCKGNGQGGTRAPGVSHEFAITPQLRSDYFA